MWTRLWNVALVLALGFSALTSTSFAADTTAETTKPAKQVAKKPRGRLPNYYRQVCDESQRLKIYAIQAKYRADSDKIAAKIEELTRDLRKELADLKEREAKEVESVLTAEQLARLEKIRAEAAAKRKAKAQTSTAKDDSTTSAAK